MPYAPADRLGPYEITGPIGAGGMGEVYKARDTRLERTVAIKVSKEAFSERFRNEALAIASLNHPHICTLYDVGPDYLVMEYVEGKPLRGPVPVPEFLRLAGQIADALEQAHQKHIVHRDLKPSNILVTKAGVKVLDFGLAKRRAPRPASDESEDTLTEEGTVAGTPRYMAPEQIDGRPADERTDIFAFGLVMYEMLTGERAFEGKSAASVMAAILGRDPIPISTFRPETPKALEKVVVTCLAKDPAERWQSVRELKHALEWTTETAAASSFSVRLKRIAAGLAAAIVVTAVGVAIARRDTRTARPLPVRYEITLPKKAVFRWEHTLAVSPDGAQIVFSLLFPGELPRLFLRPLDAVEVTPVPGAEGGMWPFWAPSGKQIGFVVVPGVLKKIDLATGSVQTLCKSVNTIGATWNREDVIVFSDGGKLFRLSARGGEPEPLGTLVEGETGRTFPQFLPDGRHYLYVSLSSRPDEGGVYVGAVDSDLRKRIVATAYRAAYTPPGHLLFVKDEGLVAQPFDLRTLELSGEPIPVLDRLALLPGAGLAHFSVSTNGVLAWRTGSPAEPMQLTWFDRRGRRIGTLGEPGVYVRPVLSPDERSLAVCRQESPTNTDIWVLDVARGASRRLTFDPHHDCGPTWSPDGSRIAFRSDRRAPGGIYQKRADGSGDDELVIESKDSPLSVSDWSADGRFLVYASSRPRYLWDIYLLPLSAAGERKPIPYLVTDALEDSGQIAPNGRWMAYRSTAHGRFEVYVQEVTPRGEAGAGEWQISSGGAWSPQWRRDGKELFYGTATGVHSVAVTGDGPSFEASAPRQLFDPELVEEPGAAFAVTRDGERFLLLVPTKPREPIRVLVNGLPSDR
jgi:eukaryotic-like serine/threonine-protein kinase